MQRPRVMCFMAKPVLTADGQHWDSGRVVWEPTLVPFEQDAIAHYRRFGYTLIGPDPVGMAKLAEWERDHGRQS